MDIDTDEVIAEWRSRGGKYFVILYHSERDGYHYITDNGCGAWWHIDLETAIKRAENQASYAPSKMPRAF